MNELTPETNSKAILEESLYTLIPYNEGDTPLQAVAQVAFEKFSEYKVLGMVYYNDKGILCKGYFSKSKKSFLNKRTNTFSLKNWVNDSLQLISVYNIAQIESPVTVEQADLIIKDAEDNKTMYLKFKNLIKDPALFDELFFDFLCTEQKLELFLAFENTVSIEKLHNAATNVEELNEEELNCCKEIWLKELGIRKDFVFDMLNKEITTAEANNDVDMKTELEHIKTEYGVVESEYKISVQNIISLNNLLAYWHPLLLPAPEHLRLRNVK